MELSGSLRRSGNVNREKEREGRSLYVPQPGWCRALNVLCARIWRPADTCPLCRYICVCSACHCCDLRLTIIMISSFQLAMGVIGTATYAALVTTLLYLRSVQVDFVCGAADKYANPYYQFCIDYYQGLSAYFLVFMVVGMARWAVNLVTGIIGLIASYSVYGILTYSPRVLHFSRVYFVLCIICCCCNINPMTFNSVLWQTSFTTLFAGLSFIGIVWDAFFVYMAYSYTLKLKEQYNGLFRGRPVMNQQEPPEHVMDLTHVGAVELQPASAPVVAPMSRGRQDDGSDGGVIAAAGGGTSAVRLLAGQAVHGSSTLAGQTSARITGSGGMLTAVSWTRGGSMSVGVSRATSLGVRRDAEIVPLTPHATCGTVLPAPGVSAPASLPHHAGDGPLTSAHVLHHPQQDVLPGVWLGVPQMGSTGGTGVGPAAGGGAVAEAVGEADAAHISAAGDDDDYDASSMMTGAHRVADSDSWADAESRLADEDDWSLGDHQERLSPSASLSSADPRWYHPTFWLAGGAQPTSAATAPAASAGAAGAATDEASGPAASAAHVSVWDQGGGTREVQTQTVVPSLGSIAMSPTRWWDRATASVALQLPWRDNLMAVPHNGIIAGDGHQPQQSQQLPSSAGAGSSASSSEHSSRQELPLAVGKRDTAKVPPGEGVATSVAAGDDGSSVNGVGKGGFAALLLPWALRRLRSGGAHTGEAAGVAGSRSTLSKNRSLRTSPSQLQAAVQPVQSVRHGQQRNGVPTAAPAPPNGASSSCFGTAVQARRPPAAPYGRSSSDRRVVLHPQSATTPLGPPPRLPQTSAPLSLTQVEAQGETQEKTDSHLTVGLELASHQSCSQASDAQNSSPGLASSEERSSLPPPPTADDMGLTSHESSRSATDACASSSRLSSPASGEAASPVPLAAPPTSTAARAAATEAAAAVDAAPATAAAAAAAVVATAAQIVKGRLSMLSSGGKATAATAALATSHAAAAAQPTGASTTPITPTANTAVAAQSQIPTAALLCASPLPVTGDVLKSAFKTAAAVDRPSPDRSSPNDGGAPHARISSSSSSMMMAPGTPAVAHNFLRAASSASSNAATVHIPGAWSNSRGSPAAAATAAVAAATRATSPVTSRLANAAASSSSNGAKRPSRIAPVSHHLSVPEKDELGDLSDKTKGRGLQVHANMTYMLGSAASSAEESAGSGGSLKHTSMALGERGLFWMQPPIEIAAAHD